MINNYLKSNSYFGALKLLYALLLVFCIGLIGYISNHLFASTIDGYFNGFFKMAIDSLKLNYFSTTGRWAQGITLDHRTHTNRFTFTILNNLFFVFSIYFFVKKIIGNNTFVITVIFYFTFLIAAHNLYQVTHLLNTSLSYTFGVSLMLIFFGYFFQQPEKETKDNVKLIFLLVLILLFITGLVEHLFVVLLLILGFFVALNFVEHLLDKKVKISFLNILYLFIALLGSLLVVFSPGSISRRARTKLKLENTEFKGFFDFSRFLEVLKNEFLDLLSMNALIFFIFMIVIFSEIKGETHLSNKARVKSVSILFFLLLLSLTPVTVGFLASNGNVGMPKAYNLMAFIFLIFLTGLAYNINLFFRINFSPILKRIIFIIPFFFFVFTYFLEGSNLYVQQNQVFSGMLLNIERDVLARRVYLMETNSIFKEKFIPEIPKHYVGNVYGDNRERKMNQYFNEVFNNSIPVYTDSELPKPTEFTSIFLAQNNMIKPVKETKIFNIYYSSNFNVLVFESKIEYLDWESLSINIIGVKNNGDKNKYQINLKDIKQSKKNFYNQINNFIAVDLEKNFHTITIQSNFFDDCNIDLKNEEIKNKIQFPYNYGDIMR